MAKDWVTSLTDGAFSGDQHLGAVIAHVGDAPGEELLAALYNDFIHIL